MSRRRPLPDGPRLDARRRLLPRSGFSRYDPRPAEEYTRWAGHGLLVLSEHALASAPDGSGDVIPQWHVSLSRLDGTIAERRANRPTNAEVAFVADAFGMPAWEEDNHLPGVTRSLWCPEDPERRVDCECKLSERVMVNPDGTTWTTPADPAEGCSGCTYALISEAGGPRIPCPVHG